MCTRIDHVFEPGKAHKFHRDLLCKSHSRDCGFTLERGNYPPCIVIKPSLDILDYTKNGNFIRETEENWGKFIECSMDRYEVQEGIEEKDEKQIFSKENLVKEQTFSIFGGEIEVKDSKFMIKDPSFSDNLGQIGEKEDISTDILSHHLEFFVGQGGYSLIPVDLIDFETEEKPSEDKIDDNCENYGENFDFIIEENEESLNFHPRESEFLRAYYGTEEEDKDSTKSEPNVNEADEAEVSIGTEIPDLEETNEIQDEESLNFHENDINGFRKVEEEPKEFKTLSIDGPNKEEDKIPDTPTSIDSLQLHKKLLMMENRESGAEASIDGSVACELEGNGDLKSALKVERKALETLYLELEEERSASAIAAKESMAMITRLQEEKAAIKIESLQYQRMIEEQSEYDQEALLLLNELLVKREKEKEALERELDVYRKKLGLFRSFSGSSSNNRDSFGLSNEDHENENVDHNTPIDEVLDLEDERISILEQLKTLEEKLFVMSDYDENVNHQNGFENGFNTKTNQIKGIKGKRLLPLFDEMENGYENGYDSNESENSNFENKRSEIDLEIDQLYGRVQNLEEDNEFLKHCISSLKKGDKGLDLLQEILQHLRDLRNIELLG